jgi:hypothetical protein
VREKEKNVVTRTDRPPENTIDEFVAFIDKLLNTMDPDPDDDATERMELLETREIDRRVSSRLMTERPLIAQPQILPPPLPTVDEESDLEIDLFEDSLMPTQF